MNKFFKITYCINESISIGIILFKCIGLILLSKNNDEQFKFHVKIIGNVADKLQKQESYNFYDKINH
jgi:two-component system phosphate regulon sensor histidine kinase PhoR